MKIDQELKTLFKISPELMCIASFDGFFLAVNSAFQKKLGYSEKELKSKSFLEFVHPDDREPTLRELENLDKGHQVISFVNRYRHKKGHYIALSWYSYPSVEDKIIYATARDISAEQQHFANLLQIEKALNEKTIFAITDADGVIVHVNENFCRISGYSKEELVGQTHSIINSGKHSREFFIDMWKTIKSGKVWSGTIQNKKKNGDYYFVSTIITPTFDDSGNIVNYIAFRHDVTDSIKLASEFDRIVGILNETGQIAKVGGWELDIASGDLTWTDETFRILEVEKRFGQKPRLPEGISLFIPEHQPIIEQAVNEAITLGKPYSLELIAKTAKGNERWVYTNGKANYADDKVVSLSGTIQDIHEKKLTEMKYEKERKKRIQTSKLASLGELAASIAHEINNPLTAIATYCELMERESETPEQRRDHLQKILRSTERISQIVKSLKKFSRTEDSPQKVKLTASNVLNEAISLTESRSKRHNVDVSIELVKDFSFIGNEVEIEQVIINLINNAIDAIKNNEEKWIKIKVLHQAELGMITVTDSGHGIDKKLKDNIFDPFFTSKPTGDGTGLGLAISVGILEEHNARIELDEESQNTCFCIYLPRINEED